jgi:integrase
VFAATFGGPIDHRSDTRCFKTLLIKARVRCDEIVGADGSVRVEPRVRLHDLRHTAATLLLAQGVPARVVMEMLGHSQIGVTVNIYSKARELHQAGEKPQVARSWRCWNSASSLPMTAV